MPIDLAASIPGLDLSIDGNIQLDLGYQFAFGFGFHKTDGFYFDTTGALPNGEEFAFTLSATLADDFAAKGTLGYLTVDVTEVVDDRNSGLFGSFGVDIRDPNGDGRFTIGEIGRAVLSETIIGTFQAEAEVDLFVKVTIPKSASVSLEFPEFTTTLRYDQVFANVSTAPGAASEFGGAPIIEFQNVRLDLGEFITGFVGPIVDEVHKVTQPVEPIVDVLRQDIGLLVQLKAERTNLLQIAEFVLGPTEYAPVLTAINAIIDIVDFVEKVDALRKSNPDGNLILDYGSFVVGGNLKLAGGSTVPDSAATSHNPGRNLSPGSNADQVVTNIGTTPGSIQFPLLSKPSVAFGLLLGKPETLFIYDMPKLDLDFTYIKSFPIFAGLNARLGGRVTASTDLAFGFTTAGFNQWKSGGFEPADVGVLFDGFYGDDHGTENTAGDRPEVTLTASIIAGPSVGIAGLVEAGVEGDITAKIDFDLNDVPTPGSNPLEYDGRLTLDELSQRAEQGLECVFDTSGQLSAGLTGFLWVGVDTGVFGRITLYENRISLYRETLATFELGCKDLVPPTLGTVNGGVLTLAYQPSADFPVRPNGDNYQVSQFTDDDVTKIRVQANGFTQNFSGVTGIEYNGTAAADNVVVTNASVPVTLRGSAGNDMLRVIAATGNMATRELFGDDGDDVLIGSDGVDILHGGAGNDELFGGKGVDVVHGSAGADELFWNYGDGADDLQGGTDADIVKLSGFDFDDATQSTRAHNDTVTLTKAGTAVSVNWQRGSSAAQTVTFDAAEQIQLDASAGGDAITVNDLRGSAVTDVVVNFGTSDTEQTVTNIVDPPEFINGVAITSEDVITRTSLPDLAAHRWFQHRR